MTTALCSVDGCCGLVFAKSMCLLHYQLNPRQPVEPHVQYWYEKPHFAPGSQFKIKLMSGVERRPSGCLEWTRDTDDDGYGIIYINGHTYAAHRVAYEFAYGPITDDLFVCHHCDNPPCCESDHLFLGTAQDNTDDMMAKGRHASQKRKATQ